MHIKGNKNIARVTVHGISDKPGEAGKLFDILGEHSINIELISYSPAPSKTMDVSFAVTANDLDNVMDILKERYPQRISFDKGVAMLSIYSDGLSNKPKIAGEIFSALGNNDINIDLISTSMNSISLVIKERYLERVIELLKGIE